MRKWCSGVGRGGMGCGEMGKWCSAVGWDGMGCGGMGKWCSGVGCSGMGWGVKQCSVARSSKVWLIQGTILYMLLYLPHTNETKQVRGPFSLIT